MLLEMDRSFGDGYFSNSQRARCITEAWATNNLFCAACESPSVVQAPCNAKATDFTCPVCTARYQLKASRVWNERRIPDAGYAAMIEAIRDDKTPNLLVMQYTADWKVGNLLLVPHFFFAESAVERRKPLAATARRVGWIGCNILLSEIAREGKIRIVANEKLEDPGAVRRIYQATKPLASLRPSVRGWTLDVLRAVESLGKQTFTLSEVYSKESELASLHPGNSHIRDKIRQQLQVLRDARLLRFLGRGRYAIGGV